jgi:hypothetical protein
MHGGVVLDHSMIIQQSSLQGRGLPPDSTVPLRAVVQHGSDSAAIGVSGTTILGRCAGCIIHEGSSAFIWVQTSTMCVNGGLHTHQPGGHWRIATVEPYIQSGTTAGQPNRIPA